MRAPWQRGAWSPLATDVERGQSLRPHLLSGLPASSSRAMLAGAAKEPRCAQAAAQSLGASLLARPSVLSRGQERAAARLLSPSSLPFPRSSRWRSRRRGRSRLSAAPGRLTGHAGRRSSRRLHRPRLLGGPRPSDRLAFRSAPWYLRRMSLRTIKTLKCRRRVRRHAPLPCNDFTLERKH